MKGLSELEKQVLWDREIKALMERTKQIESSKCFVPKFNLSRFLDENIKLVLFASFPISLCLFSLFTGM
jgi:hypothetical protein